MTDLVHNELFKNKDSVKFYTVRQKSYPYIDFEFSEGNPRTVGVLTYNVEEDGWHATVGISEDEESEWDDIQDATPEQLTVLQNALPEEQLEMVTSFKAEHDINHGAGRTGFPR